MATVQTAVTPAPAHAVTVNYYLPYTAGFTAVMTQGPGGSTSHTGTNAHAYDFDLNGGAVRASAPGTIVGKVANQTSQTGPGNSGNYVVLKHADNTCTSYAHMAYGSITTKNIGDSVAQAEHIGNEGNTGYTLPVGGGHHLHFQRDNCSWNSMPVDFVENNWTSQNEAAPVTDGSLLQIENTGSAWSIYNITQAAGIPVKGKPGVLWGAGGPNVFAADTAGALRQFTTCPNGVGWCTHVVLAAGALGSAGVSAVHTGSAIEVFATTTDGTLLQVENTGSGWQVYNITQAAGNVHIKGAPAVLWGSSGPSVFAVDTSGAMRQFVPCSTGWCAHVLTGNNVFAGGVDATMNGANIELFARSTGNHLYQVEYASGSGWSVYDVTNFSGGVQIKGTPGVLWTSGGPNIYVSDSAGRLRQFAICSGGGWCTYELTASGALGDGSGVDAVHTGSAIEVFAGSQ